MDLQSENIQPKILPFGQDGLVVRFALMVSDASIGAVQVLARRLEDVLAGQVGVVEIAPSLTSVMVRFDPVVLTRAALRDVIAPELDGQDWANVSPPAPTRRWHIPVCFGPDQAPQLDEIAALAGCSPDQAIEAITGTDLSVLAIGFAPGQPYLGMLPDNWGFARQSELTPMVPAGAVVVALRQVVLFANDSPTGWRQAGQSAFRPFLLTRPEPLVLRAGDGVRFHTVGVGEFEALVAANSDGLGGATCEVLS